jgi:hypothetical protein
LQPRRHSSLLDAGFDASTATVGISSRPSVHDLAEQAAALGDVVGLVHAAVVSPSQAPPATILSVDLYGTAVILDEVGAIIASGGSGVVIASSSCAPLDGPRHPTRSAPSVHC